MAASLVHEPSRPAARVAPERRTWGRWVPLLLVAVLYLGASVGPALFDQNEAQYAGAVREMLDRPADYTAETRGRLERGHWYVPTNDGVPRLQKPPLVYWMLMASMRVFGVNEFAARLPNALASLLWFAGTYLIGRRVGGEALGRAGALILATMAGTFIFCHLIAPEPFLAATLTLTFWCFLNACDDPVRAGPRWMLAAWVFMAVGTGCKGLHGALYPLAVAAILAWRHPGSRPAWKSLLRPAGPLVFLAILVPWYAAIEARYPGFLRDQFVNEQLGHVFNNRYPRDSNQVPFYVFWPEHLIFFLPWTFYIPAALGLRRPPGNAPRDLGRELLVVWFVVTAVSVVFSSMQDYYLLTAWGPVALWLARPWAGEGGTRLPVWTRVGPGVCLAAIGLVALAAGVWLQTHTAMLAAPATDTALRDTIFGTVSRLPLHAWHQLLPLVWGTAAAFLVGGGMAAWFAARGGGRRVLPVTAVAMMIVLALAARGLTVLENHFSLKEFALIVNRSASARTLVACAGLPIDNPSILFYSNREVFWVGVPPTGEFATRQLGIGKSLYLNEDEFLRRWSDRTQSVYLIVEQDGSGPWREKLSPPGSTAARQWTSGTRIMFFNGGQPPLP